MIDLTTCVKGQKLRLRDGRIVMYAGLMRNSDYPHKTILLEDESWFYTYKDNGSYNSEYGLHYYDVAGILPLETTEPASHPSVAWWESCPWITDREPTEEDGDESGWVITKTIDTSSALTVSWQNVKAGHPWIHRPDWQPPTLTDREQALQLLDDHQAGWRPTTEQWHIIRKGLEAS